VAGVTVKVVQDTGGAGVRALAERLKAAARSRVLIGVPAGKAEPEGTSMALVAAATEFGTPTAPERPFLRPGVRGSLPLVRQVARHDLPAVAEGRMQVEATLDRMGHAAEGEVKRYMTGPNFAPNAPSTVKRKGSSQPTIDSGALRQGVTHIVEGA
jgi:hypothetical protein